MRRIAASLSRRSPAARSGASGGGAAAVMTAASDGVVGQRADRDGGQVEDQRVPGGAGMRVSRPRRRGWSGRRRRATGRTRPPGPARRATPVAVGGAQGVQARPARRPAGCCRSRRRRRGTLGVRAERAELFFRLGFRPHRPRRRRPRAAVVLITDRRLTRGDQDVSATTTPVAGSG